MKSIFFDTETTGLPLHKNSSIYNTKEWPYIIQLSYIVYDEDTNKVIANVNDYILIDDSIEITKESFKTHNISRYFLKENGILMKDAINKFKKHMIDSRIIIGHNVSFDKRMLIVECIRNNIHLNLKETFCTMKNSSEICKIEAINENGEKYYKYPKLQELHNYLFNTNVKNLHNASIDILVCMRCYYKILFDYDILKKNRELRYIYNCNNKS